MLAGSRVVFGDDLMVVTFICKEDMVIYQNYTTKIEGRNSRINMTFLQQQKFYLGQPSAQMLNMLTNALYKQFIEKDIDTFEDFHIAMLDIFSAFNAALPGMHYDVPQHPQVEECFKEWDSATEERKKKVFEEFMLKYVNLSKLDDYTMIAGIVTPPAAMALKRAGESVPQINKIRVIPDAVFVPTATLLALISVKLTRRISIRKHLA